MASIQTFEIRLDFGRNGSAYMRGIISLHLESVRSWMYGIHSPTLSFGSTESECLVSSPNPLPTLKAHISESGRTRSVHALSKLGVIWVITRGAVHVQATERIVGSDNDYRSALSPHLFSPSLCLVNMVKVQAFS